MRASATAPVSRVKFEPFGTIGLLLEVLFRRMSCVALSILSIMPFSQLQTFGQSQIWRASNFLVD